MHSITNRFSLSGNSLKSQLLRGGVVSLAIKFAHAALMFTVSVALARVLGAEAYGVYTFAFAVVSLISVPATLGLPQLIVRETAKAKANEQWGLLRGHWQWATQNTVILSLSLMAFLLIIITFTPELLNESRQTTLLAGAILIPMIALARLRDGAIRGLNHVIIGQISETIIRPAFFIILIVFSFFWNYVELTPAWAMNLHVLAATVSFILGATLLFLVRPQELGKNVKKQKNPRLWWSAALPLGAVMSLSTINQHADILMLGAYWSDSEVGIYRVAVQSTLIVAFGLQAINIVISPHCARLFNKGEMALLQRLVTTSAQGALAVALPAVLVYWMFGDILLNEVFGTEFRSAYIPLGVLAAGQLINAGFGSVGTVLNMCGYEKETMKALVIAVVVNISLNFILIPKLGGLGAAIATATTFSIWNGWLWRVTLTRLELNTLPFRNQPHF